jgi:hypothetical protein
MATGCGLVASDNQNQTRFLPEEHFIPFTHKDSDDMVSAIMRIAGKVAKKGCDFV